MRRSTAVMTACLLALMGWPVLAQDEDTEAAAAAAQDEAIREEVVEEIIVVTASRTEQRLHEVPAAISVITPDQLETMPVDDYGDILRSVPGMNVIQTSARDINVSARNSTNTLATDLLVLLDGRSLYLDFFGFVIWDFLPMNSSEIKQIEVVRGPGSAVWGANALSGVVNVITKSPREMVGTGIVLGGGELSTLYGGITHATAMDKAAFKLSANYYEQDPYDRPTGTIPGSTVSYPEFENTPTSQPKLDARLDFDSSDDTTWRFGLGHAGTDGIIHTGIGPFDIEKAIMQYGQASWTRRAFRVAAFANLLQKGEAPALLTVDINGQPLQLDFESDTYNLEFSNTSVVGTSHILTYGASVRDASFEITIAPASEDRTEVGAFLQDEILFGSNFRWLIGARYDDNDPIGSVVSPRTSFLYSPNPNNTFRLSYNEAFRQPSVINNYLDITIITPACLIPGVPTASCPSEFFLPLVTSAVGNPDLTEESLESYEIGYVGTFGPTSVSVSIYQTEKTDSIDFGEIAFYDNANPPPFYPTIGLIRQVAALFFPGVPLEFLPPDVVAFIASQVPVPPNTFPAVLSYRNVAEETNEGIELAISSRFGEGWSWNLNMSYQDEPDVTGLRTEEIGLPPEIRANFGLSYSGEHFFANGIVNYVDDAYFTDVTLFPGSTDDITTVNLTLGTRLMDDRMTLSVIGSNIFDEEAQYHPFGDVISRKVVAELRYRF